MAKYLLPLIVLRGASDRQSRADPKKDVKSISFRIGVSHHRVPKLPCTDPAEGGVSFLGISDF